MACPIFVFFAHSIILGAPGFADEQRQQLDEVMVNQYGRAQGDSTIPGEFLVKFEDDVSPEQIESINRRLGVTVVNTMMDGRLFHLAIPYPSATSEVIAAYSATEGVEYAEPNRGISIPLPPNGDVRSPSHGGGLPPPEEDGSAPLIPLPGPE